MAAKSDAASAQNAPEQDAPELLITRVFDAPRRLVYQVWTEREHMLKWCAPHGFTITHGEAEVRVGGAWRSCMVAPDGVEHWVGGVYREVVPNERLVFTHVWDEADMPPHETLVTLEFADFEATRTKLYFRQQFFRSVTSRDGHEGGWSQSFERLESYLHELQHEVKTNG
jgi:uncharacterized protein YndB with AHSA1/START domain